MNIRFEFSDAEIDAAIRAGIKASDIFDIAADEGALQPIDVEFFLRAAIERLLNGNSAKASTTASVHDLAEAKAG